MMLNAAKGKGIAGAFASYLALNNMKPKQADCLTQAEEEAAELEKIMNSQNGGMPADPEEMQEMLAKARSKGKVKPPQFQMIMGPLRMMTNFRPNNGISFGFGVPLSERFQCSMQWFFSNTKPSQFELMTMVLGEGNPYD